MNSNIELRNFWSKNDITKEFLISLVSQSTSFSRKTYLTSVFTETSMVQKAIEALKVRRGMRLDLPTLQRRLYNLLDPVPEVDAINIWYTGENIRPPSQGNWNATLSFEDDHFSVNNIYLPFWATTLGATVDAAEKVQRTLLEQRVPTDVRQQFAAAVIGNPEPMRMRAIRELSKVGEVGLYGSVFNNPVKDKMEVLKNYTFNICFENDLYPGYVTEKVIESWSAGSIPLWWGLDPQGYINPKAIVNFAELGFDQGISYVLDLMANPDKVKAMQSEPILLKPYDYQELARRLRLLLS